MSNPAIEFYHSPNTRSSGAAILIEELGAPIETHILNMKVGEQRQPAYLAINPMGKVPALRVGETVVTEQGAVFVYLADRFADAGLAPAIDDPMRGEYLRWMFFYGSSFEPAVVDHALKRESGSRQMMPYGDYETMLGTLTAQLRKGPYLLGERFSAADILWGTALRWTTSFKIVPELPEIMDYVARIGARPSVIKITERDQSLSEAHAKVVDSQQK